MKSIALEELTASVILNFCENLAELVMPKDYKDGCDMWFRNLSEKEMVAVGDKLLGIMERDYERFKDKPKGKRESKKRICK